MDTAPETDPAFSLEIRFSWHNLLSSQRKLKAGPCNKAPETASAVAPYISIIENKTCEYIYLFNLVRSMKDTT